MSKNEYKLPSQAEMQANRRCSMGTDGTLNGGTKIQSKKGKKAYRRQRAKNPRNW